MIDEHEHFHKFATKTLYGIDSFDEQYHDEIAEYVFTQSDWWNGDMVISDIGLYFVEWHGGKLFFTGEGYDHLWNELRIDESWLLGL